MDRFRALAGGLVVSLVVLGCVAGCPDGTVIPSQHSQLAKGFSPVAGELVDGQATTAVAERAPWMPEETSAAVAVPEVDSATAIKDEATFQSLRAPVAPDVIAVAASAPPQTASAELGVAVAEALDRFAVPLDAVAVEIGNEPNNRDLPVAHGRLAGHWHPDAPNASYEFGVGAFHGHWMTTEGVAIGVVYGRYQPIRPPSASGLVHAGILVGHCVDNDGTLIGKLRGRYGNRLHRPGAFFGRWYDAEDRLIGVIKGHWRHDPNSAGGRFAGRWATFDLCEEAASLDAPELSTDDFGGLDLTDELVPAGQPAGVAYTHDLDTDEPACIDPNDPHGYYRGHYWPANSADPNTPVGGRWHARWRNADGTLAGHLIGRYVPTVPAPDPSLEPRVLGRFYAKYVDTTGQFRGFVRGHYGVSARGLGVMRGHYADTDGNPIGNVIGRWRHAPQRPGGPVSGFWWGADLDEAP